MPTLRFVHLQVVMCIDIPNAVLIESVCLYKGLLRGVRRLARPEPRLDHLCTETFLDGSLAAWRRVLIGGTRKRFGDRFERR